MATYLRPGLDLLIKQNWYVGGVSEKIAEDILASTMDRGNFLVRDSLLPDADYVLSVRVGKEIWNYDICVKPDNECILYKYSFTDLPAALAFYSENRLGPVYLKLPNEPLVGTVQPASDCKIKMAHTASSPRRTVVAPENPCAVCDDNSQVEESESPASPRLVHLNSEHFDTSSASTSSVNQNSDAYQLGTAADSIIGVSSRADEMTTSNEVVLESYHSIAAVDAAIATKVVEEMVPNELLSPVDPYLSVVQTHSSELNVLETVVEDSNSDSNSENVHDTYHKETALSVEVAGLNEFTEGDPAEKSDDVTVCGSGDEGKVVHPSNGTESGSREKDSIHLLNTNEVYPGEVEELSDKANKAELNSVEQLASNLQFVLTPSFQGQPATRRRKPSASMCPEGIQIIRGPVPVMVGTTGPAPVAPGPVIRPVKPRSISPDDTCLVAGPINTKRSGKKLKRSKTIHI